MSDAEVRHQEHRGEKGFTLVELLVVVTIIGILAAIVSVSVGGFTGKASVQAHKSTINAVQAAVDAYFVDHYAGETLNEGNTTVLAADRTKWYDTNGSVLGAGTANVVYGLVRITPDLTTSSTSPLANTTRTFGPYLRLGGNASIKCVFKNTVDAPTGDASVDGMNQVLMCSDTAQTAQ